MESANTPRKTPQSKDPATRVQTWLDLKQELELLHARLEYLRLILKLGVRG